MTETKRIINLNSKMFQYRVTLLHPLGYDMSYIKVGSPYVRFIVGQEYTVQVTVNGRQVVAKTICLMEEWDGHYPYLLRVGVIKLVDEESVGVTYGQ